MLTDRLRDLFRKLPQPIAAADTELTNADRQAIVADLRHADDADPGLGEALATFVVTGEPGTVLLRVQAGAGAGRSGNTPTLRDLLLPQPYAYGEDKAKQEKRLAERHRALLKLEGFDAGALRRYASLFAPFHAGGYRYGFPGTDRSPLWFRTLLSLLRQYNNAKPGYPITLPRLRATLAPDGDTVPVLLDCAFTENAGALSFGGNLALLDMPGLPDALAEEAASVPAAVLGLPAAGRATLAGFLARSGLLERDKLFLDLVFRLVADGSRTVRDAALDALSHAPAGQVEAGALALLGSSATDNRLAGVNALVRRVGTAALPVLEQHEKTEKARKVHEAIATARATLATLSQAGAEDAPADGDEGYTALDGSWVAAPSWTPAPGQPAPADTEAVFRALMEAANTAAREDYDAIPPAERDGKTWTSRGQIPTRFEQPFDPAITRGIVAVMNGITPPAKADVGVWRAVSVALPRYSDGASKAYLPELRAFLDRPEVSLQALVRLCLVRQDKQTWQRMIWYTLRGFPGQSEAEAAINRRLRAGADMRDVAAEAEAQGCSTPEALAGMLNGYGYISDDTEPATPTVWPVLARGFPAIDAALSPTASSRGSYGLDSAFNLLGLFPRLPRRYFRFVLDQAVSGNKRSRTRARTILGDAGDLTGFITDMLRSTDAIRRTGGARWLADRRDPATVPALRAALDAEKNLVARAAIVAALAACGDDVSDQFSEEKLLAEARTGLPKTKVDYADLFDSAALPHLRWEDGREVPAEVVQWWFARAHKLKQPGGDPLLHLALDRLDRGDAARMGQAVLSAFIQFDTRHPGSDEANAHAAANAPNWQNLYIGYAKATSEEQAFAALRRAKLAEYLNSALDHRGLLALARHAPPAEAVAAVKRYLRDHGKRANQCRALVDALAANPVPTVLQLILATSQRHKQPGLRKHAAEIAAGIAEENGWTPAELTDRTIPTAGLDEDGVLELPVGDRCFRARIADAKPKKGAVPGLALVLENPDGKPVSTLPSPADPGEAEEAKAARKTLSTAKKELAQTVDFQTARLYEAMCAGRTWPVADFSAFLLAHPVVGRLLRRVVLAGFDAEGVPAGSFRALDDGSLTDASDEPVLLDAFVTVGIAHAATLGPEATQAWATHLQDYEVAPLFEQLHRPLLSPADAAATEIKDREGWMIDTFALRSAATALGYQRGPIEDGGTFWTYDKLFPELGLAARMAFTGSFVPEAQARPGALRELSFVRMKGSEVQSSGFGGVALGKVPPVLLSEAWNDLHAVAAQGTGFDPAWEKKAGW